MDFQELRKEDVQREFAKLETSDLSESTKRDYKLFVRIFVGWVLLAERSLRRFKTETSPAIPLFLSGTFQY